MKKKTLLIALALVVSAAFSVVTAQTLPDQKETLKTLIKVNKYFMNKNADPGIPTFVRNKMRPSHLWTRAVYYEGLMALYGIYPSEEYYDYTYRWGESHDWLIRNGSTSRDADDQCC